LYPRPLATHERQKPYEISGLSNNHQCRMMLPHNTQDWLIRKPYILLPERPENEPFFISNDRRAICAEFSGRKLSFSCSYRIYDRK